MSKKRIEMETISSLPCGAVVCADAYRCFGDCNFRDEDNEAMGAEEDMEALRGPLADSENEERLRRIEMITNRTKLVNKHTRAGRDGRIIICPKCNRIATVYHFAFCAITCQHCREVIDKYDWKTPINPKEYEGENCG